MLRLVSKRRLGHKSATSRALAVSLAYFLLAEFGYFLSSQGSGLATFWPAGGLLLAALVTSPRRQWSLVLLFSAAANLLSDVALHEQPLWASLSFCMGNALQATCGAVLMQLWTGGKTRLTHFGDMLRLMAIGVLCPFLSAAIGAAVVTTLHPEAAYPITFRIWWGADVLGVLIATPLLLSFADKRRTLRLAMPQWTTAQVCEAVALAVILLVLSNIIYAEPIELSSWPLRVRFPALSLPLLVWAALRFDLRGATLANAVVAVIATYYASRGVGPFVLSELAIHHALGLQVFLAISTCISLVLGAAVTQVRLAEQQQRRLARLLRDERKLLQQHIILQAHAAGERELLIAELQRALSEIKTLRGLIPMCAGCKSIRDDDGYWQRLEGFLMKHTEAEFTHGICNDCGIKLYGKLWQDAVIHAAHH